MTLLIPRLFVFGSNLKGRHGKGAALHAVQKYGALEGVGYGLQGKAYAIPTKGYHLESLPLSVIQRHVGYFMDTVAFTQTLQFNVTKIGCGLAGFTNEQIAPLFKGVETHPHVWFDPDWKPFLPQAQFWKGPL